jgi:hypothetical protein
MMNDLVKICRELIIAHFAATQVDCTYVEGGEIGFDGECNGFRQYVCLCDENKIVIDECILGDDGEVVVRTMKFVTNEVV